jgi:hypothetical protein
MAGGYLLAQALVRSPEEEVVAEARELFQGVLTDGREGPADFREDPAMLDGLSRLIRRDDRPATRCLLTYFYRPGVPQREEALAATVERPELRALLLAGPRTVRRCEAALDLSRREESGTLVVIAWFRDGEVFVDGRRLGATGSRLTAELSPGPHRVELRHPTAPDDRVVTVEAGRTHTVRFVADRRPPPPPPPPPLTDAEARRGAIRYYATRGEWAGQYRITEIARMRREELDGERVRMHIRYSYRCAIDRCQGAATGTDQRTFDFRRRGERWQVVGMGAHMSGRP